MDKKNDWSDSDSENEVVYRLVPAVPVNRKHSRPEPRAGLKTLSSGSVPGREEATPSTGMKKPANKKPMRKPKRNRRDSTQNSDKKPMRRSTQSKPRMSSEEYDALRNKIAEQMDFYFSEDNLDSDTNMCQMMDCYGWIPFVSFMYFPRIQVLTTDYKIFVQSLVLCKNVELEEANQKIRKAKNFDTYIHVFPNGIRGLPPHVHRSGNVFCPLNTTRKPRNNDRTNKSEGRTQNRRRATKITDILKKNTKKTKKPVTETKKESVEVEAPVEIVVAKSAVDNKEN
eukprot:TRINITY_DN782033_c0_g1_i1.p1 TRINITY_DN782033_c0_g1~~TRINITY_DN782033_c0_g1_i1.p1  ORF type:complete len:284 (+),score=67.42 TRINITY_DN782033_c0_g1_i1:63-914(+)